MQVDKSVDVDEGSWRLRLLATEAWSAFWVYFWGFMSRIVYVGEGNGRGHPCTIWCVFIAGTTFSATAAFQLSENRVWLWVWTVSGSAE